MTCGRSTDPGKRIGVEQLGTASPPRAARATRDKCATAHPINQHEHAMSMYTRLYHLGLLAGLSRSQARKSAKHSAYSLPF